MVPSLYVVGVCGEADPRLPVLGLEAAHEPLDHEVEPEDVQEEQHDQEYGLHNHHLGVDAHSVPGVHLFENASNHMSREEPETNVHPWHHHADVPDYFNSCGSDVDSELEDAASQVCHVVQYHDCGSDRQVPNAVGEEDQREGEEMVKSVLDEVDSLPIEDQSVSEFVEVVRELKEVEIVKVCGDLLTGMVVEVQRVRGAASEADVEEVAIFL